MRGGKSMAFWGSDTIKKKHAESWLIDNENFDEKKIKHGRYQLSVGPESYVTVDKIKRELKNNSQIWIEPGQFAIILTEEKVNIPINAIGFISIRAGIKFRGLVNVSGFHVDPGYSGRLKFAVYNAGPKNIILSRGQSAFLIWFCRMDDTDPYDGDHKNQENISADDVYNLQGQIASPNALKKEINEMKQEYDKRISNLGHTIKFMTGAVMTLVGIFIGFWIKSAADNKNTNHDNLMQQQSINSSNPVNGASKVIKQPAKSTQ
jgi:dCTP deaminase